MPADASLAVPAVSLVHFDVLADSNPGLLPRLLQPLARRHLVPEHFAAHRAGDLLAVEIGIADVSREALGLIAGNLRQVVGVRSICWHIAE